jgi:hypothetical protein
MSTFKVVGVTSLLALGVGGFACKYDPQPKPGEQLCFEKRCPSGYLCGANDRCYKPEDLPVVTGTGGALGTGGRTTPGTGGGVPGTGGGIPGTGGGIPGTGGAGLGGVKGTGGSLGTGGVMVGTGGISGTGGVTACAPSRATGSTALIDNMADGDAAIISQDGRSGGWFTYNDGTGTQTPTPSAVAAKTGWICTAGSGISAWGAGLAVSLNSDMTKSCTYDVSVYQGISFAIQGTISGGRIRFSLNTSDIANSATSAGGTCVASSTRNDCDDKYGTWLSNTSFSGTTTVSCHNGSSSPSTCSTASTGTGTTWATVKIPFSSMRQEGWGRSIALSLAHVMDLDWEAKLYYLDPATGTTSNIGPASFDICIGNVTFY